MLDNVIVITLDALPSEVLNLSVNDLHMCTNALRICSCVA